MIVAQVGSKVGVVGTGPTACALACYLTTLGHEVHLFVHSDRRRAWVDRTRGHFVVTGAWDGERTIADLGDDARAFADQVETIFFATVVNEYPAVVRTLAPYLRTEHRVVLFSSKLCGSVHVARLLAEAGASPVPIVETDALFACRIFPDDSLFVLGQKQWTLFSAPTRSETERAAPWFRGFFPTLDPAENVIQRGLTDFGAFSHVTIMVANANRISRGEKFLFYYEALTEQTIVVLETVEREMRALAGAYGATLIPMRNLLERYYGCDARDLLTAMRTVPTYRHAVAPTALSHRFLREDISCTVGLVQELARVAAVPTPTIDAMVHLANVLLGEDLRRGGRDLAALGWRGLARDEIRRRISS
jgi:opine dehydrogenase